MVVSKENVYTIIWIVPELAAFDVEHHFHLKGWLAEKLWFFRLGYWVDIFLKMNEVKLQGKQLTIFATNNKIWTFKQN